MIFNSAILLKKKTNETAFKNHCKISIITYYKWIEDNYNKLNYRENLSNTNFEVFILRNTNYLKKTIFYSFYYNDYKYLENY